MEKDTGVTGKKRVRSSGESVSHCSKDRPKG